MASASQQQPNVASGEQSSSAEPVNAGVTPQMGKPPHLGQPPPNGANLGKKQGTT